MKNYNSIEVIYNRSIGNSFDSHTGAKVKLKCKGPTKYEKQIAEKLFLRRVYTGSRTVRECQISSFRANFLIVFSPDGKRLASTNGNHNVYIIDVATNKVLNTLTGHKRTPWTVAFHPTDNNILASGCLNGEVRVWNLSDDTFESWQSPGQTVIASVAFHPKFNLLAIATYRDIYFWDWNTSIIFEQTSTEDVEEKIRYIKFDSSGDKLITAIALKNNILSQYDSIAFREVFQFSCEKRILKDVKLIESFCETNIQRLENLNKREALTEELQTPDAKELYCFPLKGNNPNEMCKRLSFLDKLPYMCAIHSQLVIDFLNVDCFCPTRFSSKIMNMLKTNVSTFEYRVEKCYFCRYTWLYHAVFQIKMLNQPEYHTCKEFRRGPKDYHVWSFSATRSHELLLENSNELNGITEETLRYCFEQFARIHIAPHFARIMPENGLCSNYVKVNFPPIEHRKESENISDPRKPTFVHEIPVRSDCFLGFCANFQFLSSGTFAPFLGSFVELYHLFPALHQISTKDDKIRLNLVMSEWEHLYCKLLLINKIIEGDEVILKKRSIKNTKETVNLDLKSDDHLKFFEERQHHRKQMFHNKRSSQEFTKFMKQNEKLFAKDDQDHKECADVGASTSFRSENIPVTKNNVISENDLNETNKLKPENNDNCKQTNRQCSVCRIFDQNGAKNSITALQLLRKDIDILSSEISHRNDPKMQRHRIEELYKKQLETEIGRSDGALFITLQIIKKCIRMRLSNSIMELKRLLKINFTLIEFEDINFSQVYSRLFIFTIKRIITFTRSILDFLCEYKYNVSELTEMVSESRKATSSPNLSSTARSRHHQQHLKFRRNYGFDNDEPVFKEEGECHKSELSDDESNADVPENILSGVSDERFRVYVAQRSGPGPSNQSTDCGHFGLSGDTRTKLISKKVVASRSYINKHLKFLECASDRGLRDDSNINGHEIILLQNVNLLLHQLQNQSERNVEYSSHPLHRLQVWDFSQLQKPDISNRNQNVVVSECKVHNDATISISHDSTKVAVLLSPNQYDQPDWLGVFSMEWKTLGQILCSVALNQVAVSLSFSPTDHYLAVGFSFMYWEDLKMADIIFVQQEIDSWRDFKSYTRRSPIATSLIDITFLHRTELVITVNCIRWSPIPGQGLIFGNSFGEIKFVV